MFPTLKGYSVIHPFPLMLSFFLLNNFKLFKNTMMVNFLTIIEPVTKKSTVSCVNNYWPIPLTMIIPKYFERLLFNHIKLCVTAEVDHQVWDFNTNCSQTVSLGRQTLPILTLTTEFCKAMCRDPSCMLRTDMTISACTRRIPLLSLQMIRQPLHSIWHHNNMMSCVCFNNTHTKEMIIESRTKKKTTDTPLHIHRESLLRTTLPPTLQLLQHSREHPRSLVW